MTRERFFALARGLAGGRAGSGAGPRGPGGAHGRAARPRRNAAAPVWAARAFLAPILWAILAAAAPAQQAATPAAGAADSPGPAVIGVRQVDGRARVALRLPAGAPFRVFALDAPPRLVVEIEAGPWRDAPPAPPPGGLIAGLRAGLSEGGKARLVLDLAGPARLAEAERTGTAAGALLRLEIAPAETDVFGAATGWPQGLAPAAPPAEPRDPRPLVMLDPGHGGLDPGAIRGEAVEKALVMTFARDLARALQDTGRWRVAMTREDDRYLGLPERVALAEAAGAAALLSLHANTVERGDAIGASVFTLSAGRADAETEALADYENRADLAAGAPPATSGVPDASQEPDPARRAIHEIGMRAALLASRRLGGELVQSLGAQTPMLRGRAHSHAGFRVLKSPRVAAALIELGFLSNAQDLARLRDPAWRRRAAAAIAAGLDSWAQDAAARPFVDPFGAPTLARAGD